MSSNKSNIELHNQKVNLLKHCSIILVFLSLNFAGQANTYFFASSTGNDSYTSTQAQNPATPWKSINRLNSFMLNSGDNVLFKSGDIFYGTLVPTTSGTTYGAYGTGSKPIITGLTTISSWTSLGGNIWEAIVPAGLSTLNMVVINGILTPMGRYPNANTTNGGYLTYESFLINKSITDNQLSGSPNWTGAEVYYRRENYAADRAKITQHSGSTLSFNTYEGVSPRTGYGYFIENSAATLDQNGEWFYDPATKKIKIFYTTSPPPIQVSTLTNVVRMDYSNTAIKSNISFGGISFSGSEGNLMQLSNCNNILINDCDFSFAGVNGLEYRWVNNLTLQNSSIEDVNMNGIHEIDSRLNYNFIFKNNVIKRIGVNAGMISNAYGEANSSTGISVFSKNVLIEGNIIDSVGYIGIGLRANKDNQIVRKNVISNYSFVKNDGGAIYNSGLRGDPIANNIVIENNIISKAIGAMNGTTNPFNKHARAIYIDASSVGISILNNTIFDAWDGIYISQTQNIVIRGNTIYNTGAAKYFSSALMINDAFDANNRTRNNIITNNIFFAKNADQLLYYQTDRYNGVDSVGIIDSNYYANPVADIPIFMTNTTASSVIDSYSLPLWRSAYPNYNQNSKGSPIKIPLYVLNSLVGTNKSPNEFFTANITGLRAESSPTVHTLAWDNSNKITGAGSAKLTSSVSSRRFTSLYQIVGPVTAGKKYILRFKTRATKLGSYQANIRQFTGCYCINSTSQRGNIDTALQQHELLFSWDTTSQTSAAIFIDFAQNTSTIYIDDIQFFEAVTTPTRIDDYHRFVHNPTNIAVTIPLAFNYLSVEGVLYNRGSITLQPYSSKILLKDTGSIIVTPPPSNGNSITATAVAGPINCSGTFSPVTIAATGGTAPYTGTGVFITNAGKGSLKMGFPIINANTSSIILLATGNITAGKNYIVKFSTLGTTSNGKLNIILRQSGSPFTIIATAQSKTYGTSRVDHEILFTPTRSDVNGRLDIEVNQGSGTTYFDNIAVFEATTSGNLIGSNQLSSGQFETGITNVNVWSANNNHVVEWDTTCKINSINYFTISDATGAKSTVGLTSNQAVTPLSTSAKAGTITSVGGSTTVTVSAIGGNDPYTGTGTFTVNAGNYTYLVTDATGCSSSTSITVSQFAGPATLPIAVATAGPINCAGTFSPVAVGATGGTAPYTGTGVFNTNAGKGSLKISFPLSVSTISTVVYTPIGNITAGKNYILKFSTLGTSINGKLNIILRQSGSPFSRIATAQSKTYGTSRVHHEILFTPTSSDVNGRLDIEVNQGSGTTYFDNIAVFEATTSGNLIGSNQISSGQFETGIISKNVWSPNNNQVVEWDTTSKINNINYFTITDAAGAKSTVGLTSNQAATRLAASAKAGAVNSVGGSTTVTVSAIGGNDPYIGTGTFTVKAGTYNYLVTDANGCSSSTSITVSQPAARVANTAPLANSTTLNNIGNLTTTLKISSFPNPTSSEFQLLVEGGINAKIEILVVTGDGKSVFQTSGSANRVYKFGNNFAPGLYIIKVLQGNVIQILKVIKV